MAPSAKGAGAIITTGIFVIRGMPTPVDAAGKPTFTNEALSEQIKASFTEGKREAFWVATVNGIVEAISEFMRPKRGDDGADDQPDEPSGGDADHGHQPDRRAAADGCDDDHDGADGGPGLARTA